MYWDRLARNYLALVQLASINDGCALISPRHGLAQHKKMHQKVAILSAIARQSGAAGARVALIAAQNPAFINEIEAHLIYRCVWKAGSRIWGFQK